MSCFCAAAARNTLGTTRECAKMLTDAGPSVVAGYTRPFVNTSSVLSSQFTQIEQPGFHTWQQCKSMCQYTNCESFLQVDSTFSSTNVFDGHCSSASEVQTLSGVSLGDCTAELQSTNAMDPTVMHAEFRPDKKTCQVLRSSSASGGRTESFPELVKCITLEGSKAAPKSQPSPCLLKYRTMALPSIAPPPAPGERCPICLASCIKFCLVAVKPPDCPAMCGRECECIWEAFVGGALNDGWKQLWGGGTGINYGQGFGDQQVYYSQLNKVILQLQGIFPSIEPIKELKLKESPQPVQTSTGYSIDTGYIKGKELPEPSLVTVFETCWMTIDTTLSDFVTFSIREGREGSNGTQFSEGTYLGLPPHKTAFTMEVTSEAATGDDRFEESSLPQVLCRNGRAVDPEGGLPFEVVKSASGTGSNQSLAHRWNMEAYRGMVVR